MYVAIAHLRDVVEIVAPLTSEYLKVRPDLPVDFPPRNSISFPNKGYEFFEIPRSINNVLCSNLSVIINIGFSLGAVKHFSLAHGE